MRTARPVICSLASKPCPPSSCLRSQARTYVIQAAMTSGADFEHPHPLMLTVVKLTANKIALSFRFQARINTSPRLSRVMRRVWCVGSSGRYVSEPVRGRQPDDYAITQLRRGQAWPSGRSQTESRYRKRLGDVICVQIEVDVLCKCRRSVSRCGCDIEPVARSCQHNAPKQSPMPNACSCKVA